MERNAYVEQRNGGFYVAGARVSLDSIVYSFKAGDSPETIRQNFSSLSFEQVYGAVAFYIAHGQEVEANIMEGEAEFNRSVPPLSESRPELYARLEQARREMSTQIRQNTEHPVSGGQRSERIIVDATRRREPRID